MFIFLCAQNALNFDPKAKLLYNSLPLKDKELLLYGATQQHDSNGSIRFKNPNQAMPRGNVFRMFCFHPSIGV